MVRKGLKNGVLGTLRCRQIRRRGLNRKIVMINRFLVPNYSPVQIFSEKYDKMILGTLWVFFCTNIYNAEILTLEKVGRGIGSKL